MLTIIALVQRQELAVWGSVHEDAPCKVRRFYCPGLRRLADGHAGASEKFIRKLGSKKDEINYYQHEFKHNPAGPVFHLCVI